MPNGSPAAFGQHPSDGGALSAPVDPRALPVTQATARKWPDFLGQAGAERRRIAKKQPPWTREEIMAATWQRATPTPYPVAGQQCHFVRDEWMDPEPATIIAVQDPHSLDPNLTKNPSDPMPEVIIQAADGFITTCREARVRGAAGWMP
jgi:hypothetical protein